MCHHKIEHSVNFCLDILLAGDVACNVAVLQVSPAVLDSKAQVEVDSKPPGEPLPLSVGETTVTVQVTSPDASHSQVGTLDRDLEEYCVCNRH